MNAWIVDGNMNSVGVHGAWVAEGWIHDTRMDMGINILLVDVNVVERCIAIDKCMHMYVGQVNTCTVDVHVDDKSVTDVSMRACVRACMCVCMHE